MTSEEVWCQRGTNRIYGILYRPQGLSGRLPLVIISHGFGGSHSFGRPYAEALAAEGYMCYAFDFCGGGNSSRSDGATTDMSVFTERADLKAVIDLDQQSGINGTTTNDAHRYNVYSLDGKKLLSNAHNLKGLAKGTYIVNGEIVIIQ